MGGKEEDGKCEATEKKLESNSKINIAESFTFLTNLTAKFSR